MAIGKVFMLINKITQALVGADDDFSHNTRDFRRCRFIVHIADLSALGSLHDIPMYSLMVIIGLRWII